MVGRGQVGCVTRDSHRHSSTSLCWPGQWPIIESRLSVLKRENNLPQSLSDHLLGGCTIIGDIYTINGGLGQQSASLVP